MSVRYLNNYFQISRFQISIKLAAYIHGPQRMIADHFGDPLTIRLEFYRAPEGTWRKMFFDGSAQKKPTFLFSKQNLPSSV